MVRMCWCWVHNINHLCHPGNPNTKDGLTNFSKRTKLAQVISDIMSYQQTGYSFPIVVELFKLLQNLELPESVDENDPEGFLYELSLQAEPRQK